jgi:hypothetical protein
MRKEKKQDKQDRKRQDEHDNLSFGFISLIYRIFWSSFEFFWHAHSSFDMGFAKKIET